ncbi:hypothetical protein [Polynucleobacter sp. AP-Nino-20-G2]|uniref:hypothetical protein n=1 Tax=Polynucleobacter sp. AP-Nino-20-G2 TaxID=2576917 RepID=UPI001BFCFB0E|nr:hypothetical protein [Polynucleobacter sp. AP-Nino-20-G2]QWE17443.1 hypothetical protein FD960_04335 [Polynucleobacter sp. AP-Nino-20-G2]
MHMDQAANINLASIFRRGEERLPEDGRDHLGRAPSVEFVNTEYRASVFVIDRKYTLQLDELI